MNDKRGTMSSEHDRLAGLVETMMTAEGLQLAAYGRSENEICIVEDLPKAKPPQVVAKWGKSGTRADVEDDRGPIAFVGRGQER
jgi:hypothetical protein